MFGRRNRRVAQGASKKGVFMGDGYDAEEALSASFAFASKRALLLDRLERALILALVAGFFYRLLPDVEAYTSNLLIMVSEGLTAVFILIRRPGPAVNTGYAWAIAIAGTCMPLMVSPGGLQVLPPVLPLAMMVAGLLCSISAKIFLRRSFGIVPANRGVQREGPYRFVRHPIYFGYLVTQLGFLSLP
jgi:protein-S-isoprenylcysteine O-methyltransferase Ste14